MDTSNISLETTRLKLVPLSLTHLDDIFKEFTSEIALHLNPQLAGNPKDIESPITNSLEQMKKGENIQLVVLDKQTDEFLGHLGLLRIHTSEPEMGIWLKKSAHFHKYGQEAAQAIKNWADEHLKYNYIKYQVEKANIPSRKIVELLGGKFVCELITHNQNGKEIDEVEYAIPRNSAHD